MFICCASSALAFLGVKICTVILSLVFVCLFVTDKHAFLTVYLHISDVNKTKFLRTRPKEQDQDRCLQNNDQDQDHRK